MFYHVRAAIVAVALASAGPVLGQVLTLDDAITRAIDASPDGAAAAARFDTLDAARSAADTRPSGAIDLLAENLGVGGTELNRQIQVGATYNQVVERGGKRLARVGVASADLEIAQAEALVRRLDTATAVQRLYIEVQSSEAAIAIAQDRIAIAEQLVREVGRRVAEARDPLFAGTRAKTQLAEAGVDLELAQHARDAALGRLVGLWGDSAQGVTVTQADFLAVADAASVQEPAEVDLAVFEARRRRADAELTLQRANARTDPTWSAGPRYIGTGDVALVGGLSIPLGSKALNRANISRAEAEARQVEADLAVERYRKRQQIGHAAERVTETAHEVELIRDKVIPGAEQTLAQVRAGYNRGGFTFLDVSSAQTALHDARVRMVRAATLHHEARVDLDRLTGRFAPIIQDAR